MQRRMQRGSREQRQIRGHRTKERQGGSPRPRRGKKTFYNSIKKYKIGSFPVGSPRWQKAMMNYLLDMKNNGYDIKTVETDQVRKLHSKRDCAGTQ